LTVSFQDFTDTSTGVGKMAATLAAQVTVVAKAGVLAEPARLTLPPPVVAQYRIGWREEGDMFVRVNSVTGAQNIDAGVAFLRDKVIPELQGQRGFQGLTASGNRSTGDVGILGLWDTLEDLEASNSAVSKLRKEAMAALGGQISVETMEQVVAEVARPQDMVGCPLRIVRVKMDPAKADEHISFFRSDVLPEMKAEAGFLGVRNLINRSTGEGVVGTIWADEDSMQAQEGRAEERRQRALARGVEIGEPSYRTVLLSHLV
jgi:heme-degrading monooxygenase HmoA